MPSNRRGWLIGAALLTFFVFVAGCLRDCLAARRPLNGGTLRVQMRARLASLDPREWPGDSAEVAAAGKTLGLVFERLTCVDDHGQPKPALAIEWAHDAESKRWQFRLRPNVKFHDGAPLSPAAATEALQSWAQPGGAPRPEDRSVSASGEWLVIQSQRAMPALLTELAQGPTFIFRVAADGSVVGTGPFRISEWKPRERLVLAANNGHWAGRPFLDSIRIEMGIRPQQQLVDLELDKADVVELWPDQMRRAAQIGARTWSSAPVELLALVFLREHPAVQDARLRQAIALSLDRAAIWSVLLQKQGEVAGGLLPPWLSGYAFLFRAEPQLERARQLRAEISSSAANPATPLKLVYDASDPLARAVAERIAVNARDTGITMQAIPTGPASPASYDARLVRLRLDKTDPRAALESIAAGLGEALELPPGTAARPEQLYGAERALLETYRVVPLAHLPETFALSTRVKNWMPPRWGGWRLEEVWLGTPPQAAPAGEKY